MADYAIGTVPSPAMLGASSGNRNGRPLLWVPAIPLYDVSPIIGKPVSS